MKYVDFKKHLEGIMLGDKSIPNVDILETIILQCLKQVASTTDPLVLLSNDLEYDVLQIVDEKLFIRVPKAPQSDDDIIDIDETLVYAVSYLVASKISKNQTLVKYIHEADTIINNYQWKRWDDIQSGLYDQQKSIAMNSLDIHGYKKIYTKRSRTILGYVYEWDMEFVNKLNSYLQGEVIELSKSDRINIDKYIDWASNPDDIDDMYTSLDKFLGEING